MATTILLKPKYRGHIHKSFSEFALEPRRKKSPLEAYSIEHNVLCAQRRGTLICNSTRWLKGEFPAKVARDWPQGSRAAFSPLVG
jgi:hypothetical protein